MTFKGLLYNLAKLVRHLGGKEKEKRSSSKVRQTSQRRQLKTDGAPKESMHEKSKKQKTVESKDI
jgi:hypothetical protein